MDTGVKNPYKVLPVSAKTGHREHFKLPLETPKPEL